MENPSWIVRRASSGRYDPACFEQVDSGMPPLTEGKVLVRTTLMSLDPTNLNWLKLDPVMQPVPIGLGDAMLGVSIGVVIESRCATYSPGDRVTGMWGWRLFDAVDPLWLRPVQPPEILAVEEQLAVFSHVGRAAAGGMLLVGQIKAGDTVLVSGAAGATGSLAAQIAKVTGCRTIGVAGGPEKCRYLVEELGLDGAIDYRAGPLDRAVRDHFPTGVDVFFDNVGGEILDAVLRNMARGCRIAICGAISQYDIPDRDALYGVRNLPLLIFRQARMEGFVAEFGERNAALDQFLLELTRTSRLKVRTHIVEGFENIPKALELLLSGRNEGKLIARL